VIATVNSIIAIILLAKKYILLSPILISKKMRGRSNVPTFENNLPEHEVGINPYILQIYILH
jgi:hypothetical protein